MYIVKKEFENQEKNYLLKLNRMDHKLEVYQKADNSILNEHYSIVRILMYLVILCMTN